MVEPWQTNNNIIAQGFCLNHPNLAVYGCVVSNMPLRVIDALYPQELNSAHILLFNRQ